MLTQTMDSSSSHLHILSSLSTILNQLCDKTTTKLATMREPTDDGNWKAYKFTLRRAQDIFIGADFYNPRMYA